jgi:hypothetical protein
MPDVTPPWSGCTYRSPSGGFGVVLRVDLVFPTEQAAAEAAAYLCGVADVRLGEAVGRRLAEAAQAEEPSPAVPFQAPA